MDPLFISLADAIRRGHVADTATNLDSLAYCITGQSSWSNDTHSATLMSHAEAMIQKLTDTQFLGQLFSYRFIWDVPSPREKDKLSVVMVGYPGTYVQITVEPTPDSPEIFRKVWQHTYPTSTISTGVYLYPNLSDKPTEVGTAVPPPQAEQKQFLQPLRPIRWRSWANGLIITLVLIGALRTHGLITADLVLTALFAIQMKGWKRWAGIVVGIAMSLWLAIQA